MNSLELSHWARAWGANDIPFNQSPWLETPALSQLHRHLDQTASLASVCLIPGLHGTGKSSAVSRWLWKLDTKVFVPAAITQSTLSGLGLLACLCNHLGHDAFFRRESNLRQFQKALDQLERRRLVLVLDEAQHLSFQALEEVRLLLGLNLPAHPRFALVLMGDDYLADTLKLHRHRALCSRISIHCQITPWTPEESARWIETAWSSVGLSNSLIEPAAIELLVKAGGGIARSLQNLARTSWLLAAQEGGSILRSAHVHRAMEADPYVPGRDQGGALS